MRIYLDPGYKNECTVWFDNGNVQTLKGNVEEILYRLKNAVLIDDYNENGVKIGEHQVIDVYLDTAGVGMNYVIGLSNMGIKFKKCTYEKLI